MYLIILNLLFTKKVAKIITVLKYKLDQVLLAYNLTINRKMYLFQVVVGYSFIILKM